MKFSHAIKPLAVLSILSVFLVVASGCAPKKLEVHESEKSDEGIVLENFLPENTMITYSINTQDAAQKEKFDQLMSYFPKEDLDNLFKEALEEASVELEKAGLSYEEDIKPVFSENFRVLIGMTGNIEDDPEMYAAFTIADTGKALNLINLMAEEEGFEKGELFRHTTLDNNEDDMYLALYRDTVLITSKKDLRDQAVTRMEKNENSLLSNDHYMNSYKNLPKPNMGTMFINLNQFGDIFAELEKEEKDEIPMDLFNAIIAEGFAVTAEDDGMRLIADVIFNPQTEGFNFADFPYEKPYMYEKIPGDKLIMYMEAYSLAKMYELQKDILITDPDAKEDFEDIEEAIEDNLDLDLEDDILSWMDRGYAVVLQRNEGLVPAISMYVDAASDTEGAQKLVGVMDMALNQAVAGFMMSAPENIPAEEVIVKDTVEVGGSEINRVKVDFTVLSDEQLMAAGLPKGVFVEPIELYYGLTSDNYFLISTYVGLNDDFDSSVKVAENEKIMEGREYLAGYPYQLSYISVDEAVKYVDTFIELLEKVQGPMPKDFSEGYGKVKQYLAPVKYFIGGNQKPDKATVEGMMFLKIEEVAEEESVDEGAEDVGSAEEEQ